LTTDSFTVVFPSGPLTKAQRLAEIKLGKPTENPPLQNERFQRVGNDFIHRYQIDYASFLEVWTKERGNWRVATVQATLLDPDSAAVQQAITAANARFVDAFKRGDAATLAANYTDDAVFMAPNMTAWGDVNRALASAAFLAGAISACYARNVGGTSADSTAIVAAAAQYRQGWLNGDTAMALSVISDDVQLMLPGAPDVHGQAGARKV